MRKPAANSAAGTFCLIFYTIFFQLFAAYPAVLRKAFTARFFKEALKKAFFTCPLYFDFSFFRIFLFFVQNINVAGIF